MFINRLRRNQAFSLAKRTRKKVGKIGLEPQHGFMTKRGVPTVVFNIPK